MVYVQMINIGQIETRLFSSVYLFDLHLLWRRATCRPKLSIFFCSSSYSLAALFARPLKNTLSSNQFTVFYTPFQFIFSFLESNIALGVGLLFFFHQFLQLCNAFGYWPLMKCDNNSMLNCVIVSRRMNKENDWIMIVPLFFNKFSNFIHCTIVFFFCGNLCALTLCSIYISKCRFVALVRIDALDQSVSLHLKM